MISCIRMGEQLMDTAERWVGVEDVAAHLGVTKDSIYRWIDKKGFPSHRAGRLLRFKLSEVDEWVRQDESQTKGGDPGDQGNRES